MKRRQPNVPPHADADSATAGYEQKLWEMANALRGSMDAAEYKHVVLGLIFLKYISDAFEELREATEAEGVDDPEDLDVYKAKNIFSVPPESGWPDAGCWSTSPTPARATSPGGCRRSSPATGSVLS